MNSQNNSAGAGVGGVTGLLLVATFVVSIPLALFGWILDTPKRVKAAEGFFELTAQWLSAAFHVGGPLLLLTLAGSNPGLLPWGVAWAAFGSLVLARRIGALWSVPGPVYMRDWWRGLGLARPLAGIAMALALGSMQIQGDVASRSRDTQNWESWETWEAAPVEAAAVPWLHFPVWLVAIAAVIALYVTSTMVGLRVHKRAVKTAQMRATFTGVLSTVFGISQTVIDNEAGWSLNGAGHLVISPVPPAMAVKLSPESFAQLDEAMARVYPDFQIDPDSGFQWIGVMPVTEETVRRREELQRTGGLYVSESDAPEAPAELHGYEVIDLTNEEI